MRTSWSKGKTFTDEHKHNMSLAHKGQIVTAKTRAKLSKALLEFWSVPANKKRMSQAHIQRWNNERKQKVGDN